jgi:hypothetical protein
MISSTLTTQPRGSRPALSLIESLIAIFITGLIFAVVANIFVASNSFNKSEEDRVVVGEQTARLFSVVDQTLRQGKAILASATVNGTLYTTDDDTMVFTIPTLLNDGSLSGSEVDTAAIALDTTQSGNTKLWLSLDPHANSDRAVIDRSQVERVKDFYIRYNTSSPANATAASLTVTVERGTTTAYRQTNILYATFRNRT